MDDCKYCSKIITVNEAEQWRRDWFGDDWDLKFVINNDKTFDIWCRIDDDYYTGAYLTNVKYCPWCGKELKGDI